MTEDDKRLIDAMAGMDEDTALRLAVEMMDGGTDPLDVLAMCRAAMDIVGKKFEDGEYFIPELVMAGEMLEQITALVKPRIDEGAEGKKKTAGTVIIGTVHGDLHDIGKNIVTFMLEVNDFEVIDLGVDVSPQAFVEAIRENQPQVIALSGFLTLAFDSMKDTVEAISQAGLRDGIKIMIGGGQVDEAIKTYTGADFYGLNAMNAVSSCKEWIGSA